MFQEKTCAGPSIPVIIAAFGVLSALTVFFAGRIAVQKLIKHFHQNEQSADQKLAAG